jgi:hypothetical protein
MGDSLNLSEQQLYQQHHSNISSIQCKNCWEYIISPGAAASSSGLSLLPGPSPSSSNNDGDAQSSSRADHDGDQLGDWSDYELLLLQKGVRKFGNEWATIRAQFLPKRNVSELQQAWMVIRTPAATAGSSEDQEKQDQAAEGPDGAAATTRLQRGTSIASQMPIMPPCCLRPHVLLLKTIRFSEPFHPKASAVQPCLLMQWLQPSSSLSSSSHGHSR